MQIAQARQKAEKFMEDHLIESPNRRPSPDSRFMVRHNGKLLLSDDPAELKERLAKRLQAAAKRRNAQH